MGETGIVIARMQADAGWGRSDWVRHGGRRRLDRWVLDPAELGGVGREVIREGDVIIVYAVVVQ